MKKIIISVLAFLAFVTMASTATFADLPKFNTDPSDLPTVMVSNVTQGGCAAGPGSGCWKTSISANPGDTIAVQIYFHNSTPYLAEQTTVGMRPQNTSNTSNVTFTGEVVSPSIDRSSGSASVQISSAQSVSFIPGTVRIYKNGQSTGYSAANESSLFGSSGLLIGDVSPGWDTQGVVVANFKVSGSVVSNTECNVDLSASDTSISQGESTVLTWSSSDCTNLSLTEIGSVSSSGSRTVYPSSSRTYTLTGYGSNGQSDTDSVYIQVGSTNTDTCSVDAYVSPTSISRGQVATLHWSTSGSVDYVSIDHGIGTKSDDGSVSVSPYDTTTYTVSAYCNNGTIRTDTATLYLNGVQVGTQPQAITTVATVLSTTTARLNGIAIPNTANSSTYAWFEWGPYASLGYATAHQSIATNTSTYYTDGVQGLVPGTAYYYRAVVQNQYGIAYGDIIRFQTTGAVQSTTTTVVKYVPQPATTTIVAKSAPSLLELKVESIYDHMCVGGEIEYNISYRNISSTQTLQNAVLRISLPKEMDYVAGTGGSYSVVDRTLTIPLGNLLPGAQGGVQLRAHVNNTAVPGNLAVTTATVVYTNTVTHAQEDAIAYSLVTISNECPNLLGASVFGLSFLPHTLLGWLLLILVILALIVLGRQMYKKAPTA